MYMPLPLCFDYNSLTGTVFTESSGYLLPGTWLWPWRGPVFFTALWMILPFVAKIEGLIWQGAHWDDPNIIIWDSIPRR